MHIINTSKQTRYIINPKRSMGQLRREQCFFKGWGLSQTTIDHFDLGYCSQGPQKGRLIVPIHDAHGTEKGNLVGYATYSSDSNVNETNSSASFTEGFIKSKHVYNINRGPYTITNRPLGIVEEILDVIYLFEHGYTNTIALFGNVMSRTQKSLICSNTHSNFRFLVMLDLEHKQRQNTKSVVSQLNGFCYVKTHFLKNKKKARELTEQKINTLLS